MVFYILLLFSCQLLGEFIVAISGLSLPGPVCGMVILLIGLFVYGGIPEELGKLADGFLSHLTLLYIPAGVGVIVHAPKIANEWLPISVGLIVSTILTIIVTGAIMSWFSKNQEKASTSQAGDKR